MRADAPASADATLVVAGPRTMVGVGAAHVLVIVAAYRGFESWHHRSLFDDAMHQPGGAWGAFATFLLVAVFRELLHAAVWKTTSGRPWRTIVFRRSRRKLGMIVEPRFAVRAADDRLALLAPTLVFGIAPIVAGLLANSGLATLWGCVLLVEGWSDVVIAAATWRLPADARVLPIPGKLGRRVLGAADAMVIPIS